jgi:hypothetical protein
LATSFERKLFCEVPRAPSARKRLSLVRGVLVAESEIALVSRDLGWPAKALERGAGDA